MATKKDLLVLLLDVGEHMQPYLLLLHRMVFNVLNCKLLSKPNHEVAVVLCGTKGTRHKLYDPTDPLSSYPNVTVLRPLQNISSYLELEPFAFAADPPPRSVDGTSVNNDNSGGGSDDGSTPTIIPAGACLDSEALSVAESALRARVEAAGLACHDAAAVCGRAVRLFGPPCSRSDWADGLVVALDVLASTLKQRFDTDKEAAKLGQLRLILVSNLLGQSEPFDEDFRAALVETCVSCRILLEVVCLDHYVPQEAAGQEQGGDVSAAGGNAFRALPAALAAARRLNVEQLHLLKSETAPAPFRHLRQPAELLCLFRAKEVSYQASNAVLLLSPKLPDETDTMSLPPPLAVSVKLYKKIRRTRVEEFKTVLDVKPVGAAGGQVDGVNIGDVDAPANGGVGTAAAADSGFIREVEYEDPTNGQKFRPTDFSIKGYSYGKQAVPITMYDDEYGASADVEMRKFREKDLSLLGFVNASSVPHHRLIDEPHVVMGDSPSSAMAIASLALVLQERQQAGVVRFLIRRDNPQLGLLTPHLSTSPDLPHALLLSPLPFAEDIRTHSFSSFRNEQEARELPARLLEARGEQMLPLQLTSQPQTQTQPRAERQRIVDGGSSGGDGGVGGLLSQLGLNQATPEPGLWFERLQPDPEQQAAALDLVRALDLGPSPLPGAPGGVVVGGSISSHHCEPQLEALAPEYSTNPVLQRVYGLVTSRALDPRAQLPDPEGDPLVELLLQPHGRYWQPGAQGALRRAEDKLRTRDRVERASGAPATKRNRREVDEVADDGGVAAAAAGDAADSVCVVFEPTAAGGTAAGRVVRLGELTAVEDFRVMLAGGRDSATEAVRQMQDLVRTLIGRSIGDQLYGKALKCLSVLRDGCGSTGRAGGFNRFLRDLAPWCISQDRGAFVSQLVAEGLTPLTMEDLRWGRPGASTAGDNASGGGIEDDGGAAAVVEACRFLEQYGSAAAERDIEEATLPAVVQDGEFEDME